MGPDDGGEVNQGPGSCRLIVESLAWVTDQIPGSRGREGAVDSQVSDIRDGR